MAPSWGGEATSGAEVLWGRETMAGLAAGSFGSGKRLDTEVGYGLPVGSRFVGTPRVGFAASEYERDYGMGYGLTVLAGETLDLELGVDARRRESPMQGATSKRVPRSGPRSAGDAAPKGKPDAPCMGNFEYLADGHHLDDGGTWSAGAEPVSGGCIPAAICRGCCRSCLSACSRHLTTPERRDLRRRRWPSR